MRNLAIKNINTYEKYKKMCELVSSLYFLTEEDFLKLNKTIFHDNGEEEEEYFMVPWNFETNIHNKCFLIDFEELNNNKVKLRGMAIKNVNTYEKYKKMCKLIGSKINLTKEKFDTLDNYVFFDNNEYREDFMKLWDFKYDILNQSKVVEFEKLEKFINTIT